ncbi:MAG: lysophospholipid acyltransferase family protein [Christensenellales bacterium]|mgnify:FL=1
MSYYGFIKFLGGWAVRLFNPVKIFGSKKFEKKKSVFIMNHTSNMDSVVFAAFFKNEFRFVYKAEFDEKPFLRHIFHNMRLIPVKRGEADLKATKDCLSALKQNEILFIFPEGTRNRSGEDLLPFKTGPAMFALKTKTPVRPFYIQKSQKGRKRYIIVGDELELTDYYEGGLTKENLEAATEFLRGKVAELKEKLNGELLARK